jgi:N-acetylmuramoyl-L-alanine amidase
MPARKHLSLPFLIPLMLACALLMTAAAWCLGGTPLGQARAVPYGEGALQDVSAEGEAGRITCVVIDAGHGGEDGGASSASGVVEKEVNLAVAFALRDLLEAAGVPVVMTRTEDRLLYDRNVDFQGRKKVLDLAARRIVAEKTAEAVAAEGGVCLFISIHMNAFPQPQYNGMQVWYGAGHPLSAEVAESIQSASVALMPDNHRKTKVAGSNIYLLDRIKTPAVLVECGFLSNPAEAERLERADYQHALAALLYGAMSPYLASHGADRLAESANSPQFAGISRFFTPKSP